MAMLNVRVPPDTEDELEAIAQSRGSTKSDIAREATAAFLSGHKFKARGKMPSDDEPDDFAEFGNEVWHADRRVVRGLVATLLDTLIDAEWDQVVEPTYQLFKQRVNSLTITGYPACRIGLRMPPTCRRRSALPHRMITTGPYRSTN